MTMRMVHENGRDYVTIFCDACGEQIETTEGAAYAWEDAVGLHGPVLFFHLPTCMDSYGSAMGATFSWMPLNLFCEYLQNNIGLDSVAKRKKAREDAAMMGSI